MKTGGVFYLYVLFESIQLRGARVGQLVEVLTLNFSSGHDLRVWDQALHWALFNRLDSKKEKKSLSFKIDQ